MSELDSIAVDSNDVWGEMTRESIKDALSEFHSWQREELKKTYEMDKAYFHALVSKLSETTSGIYKANAVLFPSPKQRKSFPKNKKRKARRKIQKESRRRNR